MKYLFLFFVSLTLLSCQSNQKNIHIIHQMEDPVSNYAYQKVTEKLQALNFEIDQESELKLTYQIEEALGPEAYQLSVSDNQIEINAGDPNGILYATLDIIEQLEVNPELENLKSSSVEPRFPFRAIKFNLPWDSYRRSPALQMHVETCRDLKYWEQFLDMMAENRFNALTLWNLHPFSWMIKAKNFPEAASFEEDELEEWQQFWHGLFRMARERGIETYIVNWNIFVSPEFAEAHDVAPYSIEHKYFSDGDTSALVQQYNKESVTQVLNEYPELTGIGISLGEGMGGMTPKEREEWVMNTIVAGMQEADRPAKLIHRVPFSANKGSGGSTNLETEQMTRNVLDTIGDQINPPVWVEIKFNWSHGHSSPELVKVHGGSIKDSYWNPQPENYKITWMIRNEDFFCLRWGAPDFIRKHIEFNGQNYVGGYFVGSECYIPADDYFTKPEIETPWDYAFQRQWFYYQSWGHLLYNPQREDQFFIDQFKLRYGEAGESLFKAVTMASQTPLNIASYWNGTWDFTLYSEGFMALQQGEVDLIDLNELIKVNPLEPDWMSVQEYVNQELNGTEVEASTSPLTLADQWEQLGQEAMTLVDGLDPAGDVAFQFEVADVKAWSCLSLYFAEKMRAAVALESFRQQGDQEHKFTAMTHMEKAVNYWDQLAEVTEEVYQPMPLVHLNRQQDEYFHWQKLKEQVREDLSIIETEGLELGSISKIQ